MRSFVIRVIVAFSVLALCQTPTRAEYPGDHDHFRIEPPPPQVRILLRADPGALPPGARAHFPAFDGDGLFVSLPVAVTQDVTAERLFVDLVTPVLLAIGFPREQIPGSFQMPPSSGLEMPRASFPGLVQDIVYEYENNPRLLRPRTQEMIDAFVRGSGTPDIDAALETGEGMNFAQFVAGIERLQVVFPFQQAVGGVPIEHTLLLASRWEEQDVTSVRGRVFLHTVVRNRVRLTPRRAITAALKELAKLEQAAGISWEADSEPAVLLLPYGSDDQGRTRLQYVYRIDFRELEEVKLHGRMVTLWLDAQSGKILELRSSIEDKGVSANGRIWNRDPGVGTTTALFQVNPAVAGVYKLKLDHVIKQVDLYQKTDVSIVEVDPTFADFDQPPINDDAQALCDAGSNDHFQEVQAFAHLYRGVQSLKSSGIFLPFPANLYGAFDGYFVDVEHVNCEANASMLFGRCEGYVNPACPNFWNGEPFDGINWTENCMNYAHDATVIGHELGHHATNYLTVGRPDDWCCQGPCNGMICAEPLETWGSFHELADAWGAHFDSTNCNAGWVCKNRGGAGVSLYCASSDEAGGSPRRSEVTVPFNPADPLDHFPEHRDIAPSLNDYAKMQIPTAALWQVRLGLRSKCRPSGLPQYGVRFLRALRDTGWLPYTGSNDLRMFQQLYDLELALVEQWATSGSPNGPPAFAHNGPHSTNKVTAGFARAGLFLIPYQCLDGDPASSDATSCPSGELGADAVIDIDDNDPGDDLSINGVTHLEVDFLEQGGPPPTFHVWTGPRYRLNVLDGLATFENPAPCNKKFQVDISKDATFPIASTITSPWISVDRNPNSANTPECYDTWTPMQNDWESILSQSGDRLYYRARTVDENDMNLRSSTSPGNGLWVVPPPYAVITANGQSDY